MKRSSFIRLTGLALLRPALLHADTGMPSAAVVGIGGAGCLMLKQLPAQLPGTEYVSVQKPGICQPKVAHGARWLPLPENLPHIVAQLKQHRKIIMVSSPGKFTGGDYANQLYRALITEDCRPEWFCTTPFGWEGRAILQRAQKIPAEAPCPPILHLFRLRNFTMNSKSCQYTLLWRKLTERWPSE